MDGARTAGLSIPTHLSADPSRLIGHAAPPAAQPACCAGSAAGLTLRCRGPPLPTVLPPGAVPGARQRKRSTRAGTAMRCVGCCGRPAQPACRADSEP